MTKQSDAQRMSDLIAKDAADIVELLLQSQSAQWEKSRSVPSTEAPRPRGVHSDPTATTALDERRLAVRFARKQAISELVKAFDGLSRARSNLLSALEKWRS